MLIRLEDAFHALTQHVVGRLKGVHQSDLLLADQLQTLVGNHDQAVHMHEQRGDALLGQAHLAAALESEGLGYDANGQDAQLVGHLGHHRSRTGAGAAAHTGGDEGHLSALQRAGDLVLAFLGGTLANLRISTRAAALGQLGAQLHLLGGVALEQSLLVGVHGDEFHALKAGLHHAVHSVTAATANTDYLDICDILHLFIENECH